MFTSILVWIVFGLVVGAIARAIYPGSDSMGWISTIGLGLLGSLVGGFLGSLVMGLPSLRLPGHLHGAGLIGSVLGAMVVLFVAHAASRRRRFA